MRFDRPDFYFHLEGMRRIQLLKRYRLLSFIVPGLGQILSGRWKTGIFFFVVVVFPFYYVYSIGVSASYGTFSIIFVQFLIYVLQGIDAGKQPFRETSPCEDACPAGVNVPELMKLSASESWAKACAVFFSACPFPYTLGRLCPAFCEDKCGVLVGRALNISGVHREAGRRFFETYEGEREIAPVYPACAKRVAVVGAGPAGITVSYFLASCGVNVDLFEKDDYPGGILNILPDFKVDKGILKKEIDYALAFKNINVHCGTYVGSLGDLEGYDAVVVSVGASREKQLDVPVRGNVIGPLDFMRGSVDVDGKKVVVIGGGNTAFDVARLCVRKGGDVSVFYRGRFEDIRAGRKEVNSAIKEGVRIYTGYAVKEVNDGAAVFVKGGREIAVKYDVLVPAVGFEVDTEFLQRFSAAGEYSKEVFLCGDVKSGMTTVAQACGDARNVAYNVLKKLSLGDRAWFMIDFGERWQSIKYCGSDPVSMEASLCRNCGIAVKS